MWNNGNKNKMLLTQIFTPRSGEASLLNSFVFSDWIGSIDIVTSSRVFLHVLFAISLYIFIFSEVPNYITRFDAILPIAFNDIYAKAVATACRLCCFFFQF